jgi:uncharacterized protein (TIGR03663 family)
MIIRLVLLIILLLARFYDLGARPPHHDESVNGWFVDGMFQKGYYQYDPQNYHGPLYFYLLAIFVKVFGRSIETMRSLSILLGFGVNFTPFLFKRWITERGAWIAAFFLAVSPAMVFYSRYAIHEMGFMLACILFFYYWIKTRREWFTRENILGLGITLGVMACLKENFILYVACLFIGEGVLWLMNRFWPATVLMVPAKESAKEAKKKKAAEKIQPLPELSVIRNPRTTGIGVSAVIAIAFALILIFYSGFARDEHGIANFFKAFVLWGQTGENGNGHQKPFYYWLKLMFELEWFALLGFMLTPLALKKVSNEIKLMSIVCFGLCLAYSIVNYKTPWCVMSFYWGFIFIAAYWLSVWMEKKTLRVLITLGLIGGFAFSAYEAVDAAYLAPDQDGHLYIYGQTYRDFMGPVNEILDRVKENPDLKNTLQIQIISGFTWPLPWLLGEVKKTGYYGEQNAPAVLDGDYVLIDTNFEPKYASRLKGHYLRQQVHSRQWAADMTFFKKIP